MKTSAALVKLIVFVVVTSVLTLGLATTIGNIGFGDKTSYKAVFGDVTGLLTGNEVRIAGVRVGQVEDIEIHDGSLADGRRSRWTATARSPRARSRACATATSSASGTSP